MSSDLINAFLFIGWIMTGLGIISGATLYFKSLTGGDGNGHGTLWGLFAVGLTVGILLIFIAVGIH
jgi:hypothetical protein